MKQEITLDELRELAKKIPDGEIIKITIRIEAPIKGGDLDDRKPLSDAGSLDPP